MIDYHVSKEQLFYVVNEQTMSAACLLGKDFMKGLGVSFANLGW